MGESCGVTRAHSRDTAFRRAVRGLGVRPGLRSIVLTGSAVIVIVLAIGISTSVSEHLRAAARDSAVRNAESIVRGYVDPIFGAESLDLAAEPDPEVDDQLQRLIAAGDMRQINVRTRDGRVMYSTEESLRGVRLDIDSRLAEAFAGVTIAEFGAVEADGAPRRLQIYTPIRGSMDGAPIGVFEVAVDSGPIEQRVADTRRDVFLLTLGLGSALLALLWLTLGGTSKRVSAQNRRLTELNDQLNVMAVDLARNEARYRSLVQNSSDVVIVVNEDGVVAYQSDAMFRLLGDTNLRPGRRLAEKVHPDERDLVDRLLDRLLKAPTGDHAAELRLQHADGSWRWVEAIGQNLLADPAVAGVVLNFRDVTDRKQLEVQLQHEALHDPLTGLANRALFADRVNHALSRRGRQRREPAVLFLDLDDFKVVNDSLGHLAGDELLTAVAERLRESLRPQDTAARLGGDEFGILLDETTPEAVEKVARRVLDSLRRPFALAERQVFVQASIGIAMGSARRDGVTAEELLRNADAAMYTAKARGKARSEFYEAAMHASALRRLELRGRMEAALEAHDFVLEYQPIIEIETGAIAGVEALVRWRQPDGSEMPPSDFVPLAEETGLIVPLGEWVLEQACRQLGAWPSPTSSGRLSMAVNVSPRQLQDPTFPAVVRRVLAETGTEPSDIVLELTETALLAEGEPTTSTITELTELGVRIALDDFGTGYSSLGHLRRFPIDILKIDRSFVEHIDGDDDDERALVRSIVRLAHSVRLETVAEGIERPEQLVLLRALGVRFGQGFHLARPMGVDAIAHYLRDTQRIAS